MSVSNNPIKLSRTAEFAWPGGDAPGQIAFAHPVGPDLAAAIRRRAAETLGVEIEDDADVRAMARPNGAIGRYRISARAGQWFARISGRWAHPKLEQSIAQWLDRHGVPINVLLVAGETFTWGEHQWRFDLRPLLSARHFDGSLADLGATAAALGNCHRVLAGFPRADEIRRHSEARFSRIAETLEEMKAMLARKEWAGFCEDAQWAESRAEWLREMLANFDSRFDRDAEAQTLHAQAHRGNVLFLEGGSPVFVDLEEAVHTFAPPEWDIAHLVQRFCLFDSPSPAALDERLEVIAARYGRPVRGLSFMMRRIAWLSVAILTRDHRTDGASAPTAEYEKFVRLEQQARALEAQLP